PRRAGLAGRGAVVRPVHRVRWLRRYEEAATATGRSPRGQYLRHVPDRPGGTADSAGHLRAGTGGTGSVVDVDLGDAPTGPGCGDPHLQGVAETPVAQAQAEQPGAAGGAHRPEVVQRYPDRVAQPPGQYGVG